MWPPWGTQPTGLQSGLLVNPAGLVPGNDGARLSAVRQVCRFLGLEQYGRSMSKMTGTCLVGAEEGAMGTVIP
jgi:adhesin HecA-like repeat protein